MKTLTRFAASLPNQLLQQQGEQWSVKLLAVLVAVSYGIYNFCTLRIPQSEDAGLFNPVYMFLHYDKMTYPAHLYFDAMVVHPPVHYLEIALLMKLGFGLLRAAGFLLFVSMGISLWLIVTSRFATAAKVGLITGVFCTALTLAENNTTVIRPEPHLALVWFAALIALESARVDDWQLQKLWLGGFLSAHAAGLHYWAAPAIAMPAVYTIWAVGSLGWRQAFKPTMALFLGLLLFVVPYLVWFVVPEWDAIRAILTGVQATGGIWESITTHLEIYARTWSSSVVFAQYPAQHFTNLLLMPAILSGIPLLLITVLVWSIVPGTRGIAIAGGILPLFVMFGVKRKASTLYLLPELFLYTSGIVMVSVLLIFWLAQRTGHWRGRWRVSLGVMVILAIVVCTHTTRMINTQFVAITEDLTKPWQIARASGQEIMGRQALIASSTTVTWYTSGAAYWYHIGADLGYPQFQTKDRRAFLAQFDSIPVETGVWFVYDEKILPIPDWYLDRELYLQGFFSSFDVSFSLLFLSAKRPSQVIGYGFWQNQLYRFQEQPQGHFVNATLSCVVSDTSKLSQPLSPNARLSTFTYLDTPDKGGRYITSFVMQRQQYEQERSQLTQHCAVQDLIPGKLQLVDEQTLITQLQQDDQPMQFFNRLEEALGAKDHS